MPANTNILDLLHQNTFVRTKASRSSISCLEHALLLLQPFISCKCLETSVLPKTKALGGIGPAASVVYKRISSMIAEKSGQSYNSVIRLIRCKLTFSLLRSTITCLRGSRSLFSFNRLDTAADLALTEGRVSD